MRKAKNLKIRFLLSCQRKTAAGIGQTGLTYGGPFLAVSPGALGVKNAHGFVEAAVQLRPVGREAQRQGRRQLVQVVVGSESGADLPVKGVPHVDRVVPAAAGEAALAHSKERFKKK